MIVVVAVFCDIEECLEGESSVSLNRWWKEGISRVAGGVRELGGGEERSCGRGERVGGGEERSCERVRGRDERVGRREEMSWYMGGVIDLVTGAVLHFDELRWLIEHW